MKIRLTESKLKQIVNEAVKNILNEMDALDAVVYGQELLGRKKPNTPKEEDENWQEGLKIQRTAVDEFNRGGSGCIYSIKPWQINFKSKMGHDTYVTANGVVGVVGKQEFNHWALPNDLKLIPEDAKKIAAWCSRFVTNEYAKKFLSDEKYWTFRERRY